MLRREAGECPRLRWAGLLLRKTSPLISHTTEAISYKLPVISFLILLKTDS